MIASSTTSLASYNYVFPEGYYYSDKKSQLGPTPSGAEGSQVDLGDAFFFTGKYRALYSASTEDAAARNAAFRSQERPNVAVLYPGDQAQQKSQMWYQSQLNLSKKFEIEYLVYMTKNVFGANPLTGGVPDGMTFVMQNDPSGINAKGGAGVGLGVYPWYSGHYSFIYNAVAVEMDTSAQTGSTGYDYSIGQMTNYAWPHMAMVSTRTPGYTGFSSSQSSSRAYNNAKTHMQPTVVNSVAESDSFFGEWVPVKVTWEPNAELTGGSLSYTVQTSLVSETTKTQEFNNKDFFLNNYNSVMQNNWNNKVYWGFTGSNYNQGNATGIMITKLPQQPLVTGNREVLNTTKNETEYKTSTVADVGDIVTYKVRVNNEVTDDSDLSLIKTSITENLKDNEYVEGSFKFTSPYTTTSPTPTVNSNGEFYFMDSNYSYKPGEYFEYTYQVKITDKSSVFTNNTKVLTTYSEGKNLNDTTVYVNPNNLSLTKSADNLTPKVGDTVKITSKLDLTGGTFNLTQIKDSLPEGMELVPNSTRVIQTAVSDGTEEELLVIPDTQWTGSDLSYNLSASPISVLGGSDKAQYVSLVYQVKVLDSIKGATVISPQSHFLGNNNFSDVGEENYTVDSNTITFNIKTDLTIYFKKDDTLIDSDLILSSNSQFNKKNPVVIYYQTGDAYDVTDDIKGISKALLENNFLNQTQIDGDIKGNVAKEGNVITVFYGENVSMTIKYLVRGTTDKIYEDLTTQKFKDYDTIADVKVGSNLVTVINKLIADDDITLKYPGYIEPAVSSYVIESPAAGSDQTVVPSNDFTIIFYFDGTVFINDATNLAFGELNIFDTITSGFKPDQSKEQKISIINTTVSSGWTLSAKLEANITNLYEQTTYKGSLVFGNQSSNDVVIDTDSNVMYTENDTIFKKDLDFNDRFTLFQSGKNLPGVYTGKIIWSLEQTP